MREPLERLLGRETQRYDGTSGVARLHEVLGELCRDLPRTGPVGGLEPLADSPVRLRALSGRESPVEHLSVQVVREPVPGCERPVRPPLLAGRLDEPPGAREGVAARVDLGLGERGRGRGGSGRELLPDRARGGEKLAVDRVELLEHLLDQLADRVRYVARQTGEVGLALVQQALLEPGVEQGRHEQRVAARALPEHGGHLGRRGRAEPCRQVVADGVPAERPHRDLRAQATSAQISRKTVDGMLLRDGVAAPVRADDEQTRRLPSSGERIEEVDGRGIAPVQVLEDEDERELVADRLEGLEHLPEHPQVRGSDQAALNRLELVVGEEPRHLCEPGRCLPGEQRDELLAARLAGEPAERLQHGQVRLSGAAVLDALAVSDERLRRRPGSRRQVLDDGRLADPRLAGDEDESPRAGLGLLVQPLEVGELALTTGNRLDEPRENAGDGAVGARRGRPAPRRRGRATRPVAASAARGP